MEEDKDSRNYFFSFFFSLSLYTFLWEKEQEVYKLLEKVQKKE